MTLAMKRAGLAAAVAALIGAGACSNSSKTESLDDALKADLAAAGGNTSDLQLAGASNKSQVVVSAIEGGPESAPKKTAPARIAKPSPKAVTRVAPQRRTPAPAPVIQAEDPTPAPVEKAPVMEAPAPAPASAPAPREDHRVYKSEGEIFRQMPWIRP